MPIHAVSTLGVLSLDRYRRLRLCRATGDLPYTTAIPAGLSCDEGAAQTHSVSGPISSGQFRGNISAVIWNSQALFCYRDDRHMEKSNYVHCLAARYDIILLSEVHGLRGAPELWRPPHGFDAHWSLGTEAGSAGVGILIRRTFRDKFSECEPIHIWRGRALLLRLRGAAGCLDICSIYGHTGDHILPHELQEVLPRSREGCTTQRALRDHLRLRISTSLSSQNDALTLLGGDFNWTVDEQDRCSKTKCKWTGSKDDLDEQDWGVNSICLRPTKLR